MVSIKKLLGRVRSARFSCFSSLKLFFPLWATRLGGSSLSILSFHRIFDNRQMADRSTHDILIYILHQDIQDAWGNQNISGKPKYFARLNHILLDLLLRLSQNLDEKEHLVHSPEVLKLLLRCPSQQTHVNLLSTATSSIYTYIDFTHLYTLNTDTSYNHNIYTALISFHESIQQVARLRTPSRQRPWRKCTEQR